MDQSLIMKCPHCNGLIEVYIKDINCTIFRHGIYKTTMKQIDPHASKIICDNLSINKQIYGCGKPFQVFFEDYKYIIKKCDYI